MIGVQDTQSARNPSNNEEPSSFKIASQPPVAILSIRFLLTIAIALSSFQFYLLHKILNFVKEFFVKKTNQTKEWALKSLKDSIVSFFSWEESCAHRLNSYPNTQNFDIKTCSICLSNPIELPVLSTCGHPFCGKCIVECWENTESKIKLKCPYCRREMNMLYRDFEDKEVADSDRKTIASLKAYNAKFSSYKRTLVEMIRDVPFLLRTIVQKLIEGRNLWDFFKSVFSSRGLISSIVYILSPFDLLPEAILGPIGLIDDAAVLGIAFVLVANISYQILLRI